MKTLEHGQEKIQKICNELSAVRRVRHLKVKLDAIKTTRFIRDRRKWRVTRGGDAGKPRRQFYYRIAVAHPDGIVFALLPDSFKQGAWLQNFDFGAALRITLADPASRAIMLWPL